jgi:hypothetical protein
LTFFLQRQDYRGFWNLPLKQKQVLLSRIRHYQKYPQRKKLTVWYWRYETLWTENKVSWRTHVRAPGPSIGRKADVSNAEVVAKKSGQVAALGPSPASVLLAVILLFAIALPAAGKKKEAITYGEGLLVNIPLPEREVAQVVQDIAANGIIRGTKEYNKDEFVGGANPALSSTVFPEWTKGGKVFYKVRTQALDPRNFKDSGDLGTLAVRYVVKAQGERNTVLRIDALFKEDFRHTVHPSNGSVESDEYRDIQDHLDFLELMKKEDAEANKQRQEQVAKKQGVALHGAAPTPMPVESSSRDVQAGGNPPATVSPQSSATAAPVVQAAPVESASAVTPQPIAASPAPVPAASPAQPPPPQPSSPSPQPAQSLEQRVQDLRKQVERTVKSPGAPLKSAPFHTAINLQTLGTGTQVLVLISTPYWYGVETHEGQHGWLMRDQVEQP